ncbi:antitoxin [Geodermatophilus sp. Leaf369]|uniref:antitoxin n=1 Tax=Geodermatophilus sp. Leaf369 TaxID=1736354 RepID=UPI0012F86A3A|nr:antitoxin [Geodermatophilus sp. Leaf369]
MATLHLTNVPEHVVAALEAIAAAEQTTVNAVAVRELAAVPEPTGSARLLVALPDTGLSAQVLLGAIADGRRPAGEGLRSAE